MILLRLSVILCCFYDAVVAVVFVASDAFAFVKIWLGALFAMRGAALMLNAF